ncbi:Hypothetical protein CINCED_3A021990, partial [Cinara cedri]
SSFANPLQGKQRYSPPLGILSTFDSPADDDYDTYHNSLDQYTLAETETDGPISEGTETDGKTLKVITESLLKIFPVVGPTLPPFPPFIGLEGKIDSGIMPVVASLNNKEPRDALETAEPSSRKIKEIAEKQL